MKSLQNRPYLIASRSTHGLVIAVLYLILSSTASIALGSDSPLQNNITKKENNGTPERIVNRIVTEEDNGGEIELAAGDIIRVDLRFQGGAGYSWYADLPSGSPLLPAGSRSVDLSEESMVGGPVIGMWYFKALAPGKTALTMLHYRIWEGRAKATKTFTIKLRVR